LGNLGIYCVFHFIKQVIFLCPHIEDKLQA
jgi:hypothetical protein